MINEFGLSGIKPNIIENTTVSMLMKFTANMIRHLTRSYIYEIMKMMFRLNATITPIITKSVENTPKIPFAVIYFGAN